MQTKAKNIVSENKKITFFYKISKQRGANVNDVFRIVIVTINVRSPLYIK